MDLSKLETKVPPVAVCIVALALQWQIKDLTPKLGFTSHWFFVVLFLLIASLIGLTAIWHFVVRRTTVNPVKPETANELVTNGLFKYSRNPMYLAMALLLVAATFYLANLLTLIPIGLYLLYMNRFQIYSEERALKTIFGQDYDNYCKTTRRWI